MKAIQIFIALGLFFLACSICSLGAGGGGSDTKLSTPTPTITKSVEQTTVVTPRVTIPLTKKFSMTPEMRKIYLSGCNSDGKSAKMCNCHIAEFEKIYTQEQFIDEILLFSETQELSDKMTGAIMNCL